MGKARGTLGIFGQPDPRVVYSVATSEPLVALTIDDGPDPETTQRILDVLAANDARATFFLITSRVEQHPEVVDAILAAGHELANHHHRDVPSIDLSHEEFVADLERSDTILQRWTRPRWFRPGSGWYDDAMIDVLQEHGYRVALGSIYPLDGQLPSPGFAAWFIRSRVEPGAVIILHDRSARGSRTARALEWALPDLRRRGYRVVSLSTLVTAGDEAPGTEGEQ